MESAVVEVADGATVTIAMVLAGMERIAQLLLELEFMEVVVELLLPPELLETKAEMED